MVKLNLLWIVMFLLVIPVYANDNELVITRTGDSELYLSVTGDHQLNEIWNFEETSVASQAESRRNRTVQEEDVLEVTEMPVPSLPETEQPSIKDTIIPTGQVIVPIEEIPQTKIPASIIIISIAISLIAISILTQKTISSLATHSEIMISSKVQPTQILDVSANSVINLIGKSNIALQTDKKSAIIVYNNAIKAYETLSLENKRMVYQKLKELHAILSRIP